MLGAFQGWAVRVYKPRSFGNCSMSLPKPFNVFLANKGLIITGTARPVMGQAADCWPPWHCPHLAGLHCIYEFIWALHQSLRSFPSFLAWISLHCNFICSVLWLRQHHPTEIRFHSPSYLALFLQGAHVWAYVRPTWLAGVFFLPPPPSLFHMSANTVMHTVSARSNCEPGSISIFSSAGSGPASVNRWTSLQAARPSMAYSPSGFPVSLKSQPLFYFETWRFLLTRVTLWFCQHDTSQKRDFKMDISLHRAPRTSCPHAQGAKFFGWDLAQSISDV